MVNTKIKFKFVTQQGRPIWPHRLGNLWAVDPFFSFLSALRSIAWDPHLFLTGRTVKTQAEVCWI